MRIPLAQYRDLLVRYLRPQSRRASVLALLLCGSIGLQLANPQVLRAFIDAATSHSAQGRLARIALLFICIAIVQRVLSLSAPRLPSMDESHRRT